MITKEYLHNELVKRIKGYKPGVETTTDNIIAEMKSILILVDALNDYEKKYKEALERAKNYHDNNFSFGTTKLTEAIFPELHESEDEKIRKAVVSLVYEMKGTYQSFAKVELDKMVAWLEKQKEQKPILEVFGFKVGDAVRLKDGDGRKHIIKSFEEVEGVHGPNFYHVEFEDNSARDGIYPGEEYPNGYYTQMEKFEEEQKPAWSEEDEKMRNLAIEWAETMSGQFSFVDMGSTDFRKIVAWLKSLRPSWKPSEEQMDALAEATMKDTFPNVNKVLLESLYEQLKKL